MAGGRPERLAALRELIEQVQPVVAAHEQTLPVDPALRDLLPFGGLQRGTTICVGGGPGATSLALALVAGPSRSGAWVGCVSVDSLGWVAAAELGVDLDRVAVVRADVDEWPTVAAALVDGFDVVLCGPDHRPDQRQVARLAGRARERGAVVVALEDSASTRARPAPGRSWPGADVRLMVDPASPVDWQGPGQGWGRLRSRSLTVLASGRHGADRARRIVLGLPGPDGVGVVPGDVARPAATRPAVDVMERAGVVPFPARSA